MNDYRGEENTSVGGLALVFSLGALSIVAVFVFFVWRAKTLSEDIQRLTEIEQKIIEIYQDSTLCETYRSSNP